MFKPCEHDICNLNIGICQCQINSCIDCKYPDFMCKCINNNSDLVIELMKDIININKGLKNGS